MPLKIKPIPTDPLARLGELWPYLHPWQRTFILTRAVFFALPGFQAHQWRKHAHWLEPKAYWI